MSDALVKNQSDWSENAPSRAVIEAISAVENVEPTSLSEELGTTLFNHVDPEALDRLVTADTDITIAFTFAEYRVRIDGNTLSIDEI